MTQGSASTPPEPRPQLYGTVVAHADYDLTVEIEVCPRCGGTHPGLLARKLAEPVPRAGWMAEYVGHCPRTFEPVYFGPLEDVPPAAAEKGTP